LRALRVGGGHQRLHELRRQVAAHRLAPPFIPAGRIVFDRNVLGAERGGRSMLADVAIIARSLRWRLGEDYVGRSCNDQRDDAAMKFHADGPL
jgi:hypothetical protein